MSENKTYIDPELLEEEDEISSISFQELLKKILSHWKIYAGTFTIGVLIGIIIYLSTPPKYESKAMMLLNVEDDGMNAFKSLQELVSSYNPRLMYENEVVIMKSNKLCLRTIESFDYEVSYFVPQFLKKKEITLQSPVQIILDKEKPQLINTNFTLYEVDEQKNTFKLRIKYSGNEVLHYQTRKKNELKDVKEIVKAFNDQDKTFSFDQWIESKIFRFKIERKTHDELPGSIIFRLNSPLDKAIELSKNLSFTPTAKESSGVDITVRANSPEKTDFLLRRHIAEYEKLGREIKNENIIKTLDFINLQLQSLSDSLRIIEAKIQRMRAGKMLINSAEQGKQFLTKLYELDKQEFELKMTEKFLRYLLTSSEVSTHGISTVPQASGINDPILISLINQLNQLNIQRRKLGDLSDNNPVARQINEQIKSTMSLIRYNAENLLKNTEETIRQNSRKIAEIESKLSEIPGLEIGMISIERNYKIIENIYNFFLYKKSELEISLNFNKSGVLFIDFRNIQPVKISPKLAINVAAGGLSLFGISFLLVLGGIMMKNTIDEITNLEIFTHLNFIAEIPHYAGTEPNVVLHNPQSHISESYRIIRSKIKFFKNPEEGCVTILITSFVPGEGKSFTSLNLSTLLALSKKKVLLIGADMRKPKLYEELKVKNDKGLSTLLSGHTSIEESISNTYIENLYLLSAGPIPPNPSELIITKRFEELMNEVKKQFDYIIIDTPPMLAVNDANEIMNYSDINLVVVRRNVTQLSFLKNLERRIKRNQIRNVGILLNDFKSDNIAGVYGSYLNGTET